MKDSRVGWLVAVVGAVAAVGAGVYFLSKPSGSQPQSGGSGGSTKPGGPLVVPGIKLQLPPGFTGGYLNKHIWISPSLFGGGGKPPATIGVNDSGPTDVTLAVGDKIAISLGSGFAGTTAGVISVGGPSPVQATAWSSTASGASGTFAAIGSGKCIISIPGTWQNRNTTLNINVTVT